MRNAVIALVIALLFAGAAMACPGTWIQQQGQTAIQTGSTGYYTGITASEAMAVGAGYIAGRNGPAPGTPLHSVLHQFTTGVSIIESYNLNQYSTVQAKVDAALGPYDGQEAVVDRTTLTPGHGALPGLGDYTQNHFNSHYVDGFIAAGATGSTGSSVKRGG